MCWNMLWSKWNVVSQESDYQRRKPSLQWAALKLTWSQTDVNKANPEVCPSWFDYLKRTIMSTVSYILLDRFYYFRCSCLRKVFSTWILGSFTLFISENVCRLFFKKSLHLKIEKSVVFYLLIPNVSIREILCIFLKYVTFKSIYW